MNFWRISKCGQEFLKIRKQMERGRLQLGCFSLLVALGRGSRVGHKAEWAGLACWPAHPRGGKRASTWAPGAAVGPRREEAQDLKKRRPSAFSLLMLDGLRQRWCAACLRVVHAGWRQDGDRARTWSRGCYSVDTTWGSRPVS